MPKQREYKPKKCKVCHNEFQPYNSMQKVCNPRCAQKFVEIQQEKAKLKQWRQEKKEWKEKNKKLTDLIAEAQVWFNAYIRERDYYEPCISCGRFPNPQVVGGTYDSGHYRSRGAAPHLRFNEDNCHKQCKRCNRELSGNVVEYRRRLGEKIGLERLEALENDNTERKYTREELKEIKSTYARKARELRNARENQQ